jgi:HlyD family secretion protein
MTKNFVKKHWKKLIVLLLVVVISLAIFWGRKSKTEVKKETIKKGQIKEELILSGEVNATYYAKLSFETSGKIIYIGVKEGEEVRRGKLLTKLDTTILNSAYQQALAALRIKEATVANIHDQVKGHSGDETYAQKDVRTTAEAAKDSAYESVIQAKRSLDGASIFAPFNGIVTYLANPFVGVNASVTQTQVEIIDPESMYFEVLADQTEVTRLKPGQSVEMVLDSFEEKTFKGIIENISFVPKGGETGSSYSIKVKFEDVDLKNSMFRIGMSGDAKFVVAEKDDAYYVPSDFVNTDKGGKYIKLESKNGKKYIETGLESEDDTEIIGDFKEGQTVYD